MLSLSKILLTAAIIGGVFLVGRLFARRAQNMVSKAAEAARGVAAGGGRDAVELQACPRCGAYVDLTKHECKGAA